MKQRWYTFTERRAGMSPRILHVNVRVPVVASEMPADRAAGLFPLVVFAPGYLQCAKSYKDLLAGWASAGYVVAAVQFPLTNCHVLKPDEEELVNQPADVAFVIRRLLSMSAQPQEPLSGLIDPSRIAVAGHSDGGDTMAGVAAASCCRVKAVRAALILSGAEWPPGWRATKWFAGSTPPMMFVQGTDDSWNPPQASVQLYQADTTGPRYYLDLPGANHFTPYEGDDAPEPVVERVTLDFLDYYVAGQTARLAAMENAGQVPGVSRLVTGGQLPVAVANG